MTTDELNAIVKAVMDELEKAGVDFDFKAETPQADDLVYVMRGTADKYQGITVKWQNLLDIIVQKATEAKDEAVSAKDIALQTLATIQGIESNVSSMKASVETTKSQVETMKASVEASEVRVTQIKAEAEQTLEEATQTVSGKVSYTDALTYEQIMATTDLTNKVASASVIKDYDSIRYIKKYYLGSEVNNLGGFENTVKDFVNNFLQNDYCYTGIVTINSQFAFIGQKYAGGLYGAFLLIGFDALYLVQLNNGAFTFRAL